MCDMEFRKTFFLGFFAVMLFFPGVSDDYSTVYGSEVTMDHPFTTFRDGIKFEGCGDSHFIGSPGGSSAGVEIPKDLGCGMGEHTIDVYIDEHSDTDDNFELSNTHNLDVTAFNMGDPNKASFMVIRGQLDNNNKGMRRFFLTNDPWHDDGGAISSDNFPESDSSPAIDPFGYMMISEASGIAVEDNAIVVPQYGTIIGKDDLNRLTVGSPVTWSGGNDGGFIGCESCADNGFQRIIDMGAKNFGSIQADYRQGCKIDPVDPYAETFNDCAPLHDGAEYRPDGQIIRATSLDKTSFYSSGNEGQSDETNFYVCRGDYKGGNVDDSKVVQTQIYPTGDLDEPEWNYYRCNMNNEWVQASCPPGRELVIDAGDNAECQPIDEINIQATYFNVSNVSFNAPSNGYTTGFKINRSELDKYIAATGVPATVDAECWMGEDNDRPSNPDGSVTFTAQDSGSGDLWMLEKVPGRSSAENSTYSCIWGLRNTQADSDENIYDTANNDPINSRDGGRIDIKFDDIQSQAASSSTSEIGRWVWDFYEKPEDGGFDYRTAVNNQYHFMFDNEFPYCEGTSFWSSVGSPERVVNAGNPRQLANINCSGGAGGGSSSYPDYADTPDAVTSGPSEVEVGNSIQFDGSGSSDTDGTIESYSWEVRDGSGATVSSGSGSDFRFTPSTSGTFTLQLNVTDNYGAVGTTTDTFEVNDNVNTADEFTVGYVPAYISSTEASNGEWQNLVDTAHNSLKNNLKMDGSKLAKLKLDPSELNFNGCSPRKDCLNQLESQCPEDCPVDADDYDKLHLICDNSDPFDGENGPCNSGGGIANMQGTYGVTVFNGDSDDLGDTVPHEIGHNLGLEHVWNPDDMLADGYSVGETTSDTWDVVIDQCVTIPSQYKDPRDGTPFEIKEIHEERRWGNHNSDWKNLEDNRESTPASMDRVNYIMSYCGPEEGFGPEAENYMENNQLSGYQ